MPDRRSSRPTGRNNASSDGVPLYVHNTFISEPPPRVLHNSKPLRHSIACEKDLGTPEQRQAKNLTSLCYKPHADGRGFPGQLNSNAAPFFPAHAHHPAPPVEAPTAADGGDGAPVLVHYHPPTSPLKVPANRERFDTEETPTHLKGLAAASLLEGRELPPGLQGGEGEEGEYLLNADGTPTVSHAERFELGGPCSYVLPGRHGSWSSVHPPGQWGSKGRGGAERKDVEGPLMKKLSEDAYSLLPNGQQDSTNPRGFFPPGQPPYPAGHPAMYPYPPQQNMYGAPPPPPGPPMAFGGMMGQPFISGGYPVFSPAPPPPPPGPPPKQNGGLPAALANAGGKQQQQGGGLIPYPPGHPMHPFARSGPGAGGAGGLAGGFQGLIQIPEAPTPQSDRSRSLSHSREASHGGAGGHSCTHKHHKGQEHHHHKAADGSEHSGDEEIEYDFDSGECSPQQMDRRNPEDLTPEQVASVPRNADGEMTSVGSIPHLTGHCKPCVFFNNPNKHKTCHNGIACNFCHFPHPPKKRPPRPSKKQRELARAQRTNQMSGGFYPPQAGGRGFGGGFQSPSGGRQW